MTSRIETTKTFDIPRVYCSRFTTFVAIHFSLLDFIGETEEWLSLKIATVDSDGGSLKAGRSSPSISWDYTASSRTIAGIVLSVRYSSRFETRPHFSAHNQAKG
jgi:hypothetical protein